MQRTQLHNLSDMALMTYVDLVLIDLHGVFFRPIYGL